MLFLINLKLFIIGRTEFKENLPKPLIKTNSHNQPSDSHSPKQPTIFLKLKLPFMIENCVIKNYIAIILLFGKVWSFVFIVLSNFTVGLHDPLSNLPFKMT